MLFWRLKYWFLRLINYKNVFVEPEKKQKPVKTQAEKDLQTKVFMLIGGLIVLCFGIGMIYLPASFVVFGLFWMVYSGLCPFIKQNS